MDGAGLLVGASIALYLEYEADSRVALSQVYCNLAITYRQRAPHLAVRIIECVLGKGVKTIFKYNYSTW